MRAMKLVPLCSYTTQRSSRGAASTRLISKLTSLRAESISTASPTSVLALTTSAFSATPSVSTALFRHLALVSHTLLAALQSSVTLTKVWPSSAQVPTLLPKHADSPGEQGRGTQAAPPLSSVLQLVSLRQYWTGVLWLPL